MKKLNCEQKVHYYSKKNACIISLPNCDATRDDVGSSSRPFPNLVKHKQTHFNHEQGLVLGQVSRTAVQAVSTASKQCDITFLVYNSILAPVMKSPKSQLHAETSPRVRRTSRRPTTCLCPSTRRTCSSSCLPR